jgi:hypothetical protein
MRKHELALQLRQRQYALGEVERELIDALSDDIIDSYITCSHCGEKQVDGPRLALAVAKATDADGFFGECDRFAGKHAHRGRGPLA